MKKLFLLIFISIFSFSVMGQPPAGPANKGMTFGRKINGNEALNADELSSFMKDKSSAEVKVKGKVTDVCKAEGCWLKMETVDGSLMIRMKDHAFMVPLAISGKTIVASGIANYKESSVELLRHYAEDAGKSAEEIAAITSPKKEIVLMATGIVVL